MVEAPVKILGRSLVHRSYTSVQNGGMVRHARTSKCDDLDQCVGMLQLSVEA